MRDSFQIRDEIKGLVYQADENWQPKEKLIVKSSLIIAELLLDIRNILKDKGQNE